jgi:hypothetical protein
MTRVFQTPTFKRSVKRLRGEQKAALDAATRAVMNAPTLGDAKVGDLAGVRVHKFRDHTHMVLMAYEYSAVDDAITLLALRSHENFYRDFKRG